MQGGVLLAAIAGIVLAGCGPVLTRIADQNATLVAAAPLSVTDEDMKDVAAGTKREFLGRVVRDSIQKCNAFMNRLAITENTVNTTGDVGATILSALATILTPVSTVHALSGAATIVTGTKSAVDADIYAKASITNFQSALAATYYKSINDYTSALPKLNESEIVVSGEVSKIETIHSTCGLAPAQLAISMTLAGSNASGLCQFTAGPSAGQTKDLSPIKLPIGTPCQDSQGSSGVIVSAGSTSTTTQGAQPGAAVK